MQRSLGRDRDAGAVIRLGVAVEDAGNVAELAADFLDHLIGRLGDGIHCEGGEGKGKHAADEKTDDDLRGEQVDAAELDLVGIGDEERQRRQRGGTDGKALAHGGGRVADGVELVRDLADMGIKTAHLGDAAGVVGDRPVGVNGDGDAGGREHADGCERDAV